MHNYEGIIKEVVPRGFGCSIESIERTETGGLSQSYKVHCNDGIYFVQFPSPNAEKHFRMEPRKKNIVYGLMRNSGIPAPDTFYTEDYGPQCLVSIDFGTALNEHEITSRSDKADIQQIWLQLGTLLGNIHSERLWKKTGLDKGYGYLVVDGEGLKIHHGSQTSSEWYENDIRYFLGRVRNADQRVADMLESYFLGKQMHASTTGTPVFTWGDLYRGDHILLRRDHNLSGLIDPGNSRSGPPELDITDLGIAVKICNPRNGIWDVQWLERFLENYNQNARRKVEVEYVIKMTRPAMDWRNLILLVEKIMEKPIGEYFEKHGFTKEVIDHWRRNGINVNNK